MKEIIEEFEILFKQTIQPYLEKFGFKELRKNSDTISGTFIIVFSSHFQDNTKYISFDFSLHHYDLFDGISVCIYTEKEIDLGFGFLTLNEIAKDNSEIKKIYSPLVLRTTMPTILQDFQLISDFFIEKTDLLKYENLFHTLKKNNAP